MQLLWRMGSTSLWNVGLAATWGICGSSPEQPANQATLGMEQRDRATKIRDIDKLGTRHLLASALERGGVTRRRFD
jgi:hypothetical protein